MVSHGTTTRAQTQWLDWAIPLVLLLALTIPFWVTDFDKSFSARFYDSDSGWPRGGQQPWAFCKHYGVIPAWMLSLSALVLLFVSVRVRRLVPHRKACLFLVLVMIAGPGVLVNTVFKENWGRPRPKDIVEFGRPRQYVEVWVKNTPSGGNSFASGHAASAFYILTPYFLFRRRRKGWAALFLGLGLTYGSLVGIARILQGAHFLSDVLWAAGFVYLSGLVFFYMLRLDKDTPIVDQAR
jgi:membrane-associated PAP2 superfamily phosphatase